MRKILEGNRGLEVTGPVGYSEDLLSMYFNILRVIKSRRIRRQDYVQSMKGEMRDSYKNFISKISRQDYLRDVGVDGKNGM